jgi:hypothetical protein
MLQIALTNRRVVPFACTAGWSLGGGRYGGLRTVIP